MPNPKRTNDEAVRAATGKTWAEWFAVLDAAGSVHREKTLGDFVEVELIGETTDDVATVRNRMLHFLHTHGISDPDADQVGYPYLLLFGDRKD